MRRLTIFLDDGGVMNDNAIRVPQWQQLVAEYLAPRLGGEHDRWAEANRIVAERAWDAWMERDPIPMYHQRLLRLGVAEGELTEIQQEVAQRVDDATEYAKASAPPGESVLLTDVWADGGSAWRN